MPIRNGIALIVPGIVPIRNGIALIVPGIVPIRSGFALIALGIVPIRSGFALIALGIGLSSPHYYLVGIVTKNFFDCIAQLLAVALDDLVPILDIFASVGLKFSTGLIKRELDDQKAFLKDYG